MASDPQDLTGRDLDLAVGRLLFGCAHDKPVGIPELFAEIAARCPEGCEVSVRRMAEGDYVAEADPAVSNEWVVSADVTIGSTPNEALARLLLMVAQTA